MNNRHYTKVLAPLYKVLPWLVPLLIWVILPLVNWPPPRTRMAHFWFMAEMLLIAGFILGLRPKFDRNTVITVAYLVALHIGFLASRQFWIDARSAPVVMVILWALLLGAGLLIGNALHKMTGKMIRDSETRDSEQT